MATALHLPAISQAPVAKEFPKVWEHRKDLSHWSKHDVPSLKLSSKLDTDHWAKLKGKHVEFVNYVSRGIPPNYPKPVNSQHAPGLSSAFQRYYFDHGRKREELLKKTYTMYYQDKPVEGRRLPKATKVQQEQSRVERRPSVYYQRAKEGFKFWLERDPMINKISLCSKYTFGSKGTFHGLGNAPRN